MPRYSQIGLLRNQPTSKKYIQENAGQFFVNILPKVKYNCITWSLPEITGNQGLEQPIPFRNRPVHGTKLNFGPMSIRFLVDQNLENYLEIFEWMIGNSPPRTPIQHKEWLDVQNTALNAFSQKGAYSDASLLLFTTQENPHIEVQFTDLFPVHLGNLTGTTTTDNARELVCEATFLYRDYTFVRQSTVK